MAITEKQRQRLSEAVARAEYRYDQAKLAASQSGRSAPVRHKCFISYHGSDIEGVTDFVEAFSDVFIPRVVGVSDSDHFKDPVNSTDEEYIRQQIGLKYLSDSTVTILYVGPCTWARKYVDWELSSTLRHGSVNKRSGLFAITPFDRSENPLPKRFSDNFAADGSLYARYFYYPQSETQLRGWIEDAFTARSSRSHLIKNERPLMKINFQCP